MSPFEFRRSLASLGLAALLSFSACADGDGKAKRSQAPLVVDAGDNRSVLLGTTVELEGSSSATDADFQWEITTRPAGSVATILAAEEASATFVPDVEGAYAVELLARSGARSATGSLLLSVLPNLPPVAAAGAEVVVVLGGEVELDGRGSSDPEGQRLSWAWTIRSRPDGSDASLHNPESRTPRLAPDRAGRYEIDLQVSDGFHESAASTVVRAVEAVVVEAGPDQEGLAGEEIVLSGEASGGEAGSLAYTWSFMSRPAGSVAPLEGADTAHARFTADVAGHYLLELRADDGISQGADQVRVYILPPGGFVGSVIHVSPTGDDAATGMPDEPLATIGAALDRIAANAAIQRIQLAAGVYDDESFAYGIEGGELEIVGPESEEETATLIADAKIFELTGTARLSLHRLALESSEGTALIARGSQTSLGLTSVVCTAVHCIQAGTFLGVSGGAVRIHSSRLIAVSGGSGVSGWNGPGVTITDTTLSGYATAINLAGKSLLLHGSTLTDNDTGLNLLAFTGSVRALVDSTQIYGGTLGAAINVSTDITFRDSSLGDSLGGLEIGASSVLLDGVSLSNINGYGVIVGGGPFTDNETLVVRNSNANSIAGPVIRLNSRRSVVDLGNRNEPGGNNLSCSTIVIDDRRPVDGQGVTTIRGTALNRGPPTPGTYNGPYNVQTQDFRIQNAGNQLIAY